MSLTLEAEQRLDAVGLIAFFYGDTDRWMKIASETYAFVKTHFPNGATIRRDDVTKALIPLLQVDEALMDFLNQGKLKQKYWIGDFADLMMDRTWEVITAPAGEPNAEQKQQ